MSAPSLDGVVLRQATADDLASVERLLTASGLPTVGVADALCTFVVAEREGDVAEREGDIVGVVGLEVCGDHGLLRSTAVDPAYRDRGLGRALVERIIAEAEARGIHALYLLTTTAERYFPSFGFATITRDTVPSPIRATAEFAGACPASATVMCLTLPPATKPASVLFLCTGNSARSQIAEALLSARAKGRFRAGSAGIQPAAAVNPYAIEALRDFGIDWSGKQPKTIDQVLHDTWDMVITVCDRAKESCPVLPGHPTFAHWSIDDPAAVAGDLATKRAAFRRTAVDIARRIDLLLAVPASRVGSAAGAR